MTTMQSTLPKSQSNWTRPLQRALLNTILVLGAVLSAFPFYWMLVLGTHSSTEIFSWPPSFLPGSNIVENYETVIKIIPFWRNLANSAFVAITHTALVLLFCSMGGYAFAMYRFPGRNKLFAFVLATMMIPWIAGIIPWFILISKWFHWTNHYEALIIPGAASAFGIFWIRQYIQETVPAELLDAARIDGCPEFLVFFRVQACGESSFLFVFSMIWLFRHRRLQLGMDAESSLTVILLFS